MSGVISEILRRPGRYVVVGVPCFVKALRLACRESTVLKERVAFVIGIVCGHFKSTSFAELFAWQCGIMPAELRGIDFRTKLPDRSASSYAVTVTGEREGQPVTVTKPTSELFGSNWGHGLFKYKACEFCDDVVGETADISIGDAWLPEYESDSGGTNVVVVRSPILNSILSSAVVASRVHLEGISAEKVVASQAGGIRHRRDGLAFRLYLADRSGSWRPTKRVQPSCSHLGSKQWDIFKLRYEIGQMSHSAFTIAKKISNLDIFLAMVMPLTVRYDRHYRRPLLLRVLGKIKRIILSLRWRKI
jgi:coenzyme F420 hydrogenase subunit beta